MAKVFNFDFNFNDVFYTSPAGDESYAGTKFREVLIEPTPCKRSPGWYWTGRSKKVGLPHMRGGGSVDLD